MSPQNRWLSFVSLLTVSSFVHADEPLSAKDFVLPDHLEATDWAKAPMFFNPTNIDIDERGRVWVAEAVNYRNFNSEATNRMQHDGGDRIVVLEDTDNDGAADTSTVFIQDPDLIAPLGIAVFGNRVVVSCSPALIVYTDMNRDGRFDFQIDKKEILLTGFGGRDHDHGLHAVVAGPDGRWYFNVGNAGSHTVTDKSGWTLRAGSWYTGGSPYNTQNTPGRKSDDGRVYVGGLAMSVNPDGSGLSVHAHNSRNNYEFCLDSFGNLFQNDNDDQVMACRTTWLMQHANAGYASADGTRSWQADRRPGQPIPDAHWHQDDPGVIPFGDLYGAGSPTGMAVYEGDALGKELRGMLLSCEAGRNVVFGYKVLPQGAGFDLRRFSFFRSGLPDDPNYKWNDVERDRRKWFRPSDVAVGIDGAVYVADWFDPIVGGHSMHDQVGAGAIYRIAPKGQALDVPTIDLNTIAGQIAAIRSPAPNVRFLGFEKLRERGEESLPAVIALLDDNNPFVSARAIWLMAQLGQAGHNAVAKLFNDEDPYTRILAFRALRRAGADVLVHAEELADDPSPAVRREVALAMRDVPLGKCRHILVEIARRFDGKDRWYLEALGIAAEGKEEALFSLLTEELGTGPLKWDERLAGLMWRLHPISAIESLANRALSADLSKSARKQAIDTLAFIHHPGAAAAMIEIASRAPDSSRSDADWWIQFRGKNRWRDFPSIQRYSGAVPAAITEVSGVMLPQQAVYTSDVIGRGEFADIEVDIVGAKGLYLVVTDAGDGNSCDWADWIEPRLVGPQGDVELTSLSWKQATSDYGQVRVDRNCRGLPLRTAGRPILNGIGTHASSVIVYDIADRGFEWFTARGGLDNGRHDLGGTEYAGGEPSVVFHVYHDGPTPELRANKNESVILDQATAMASRKKAAIAMTRSKAGGMRLIALASQDKLPDDLHGTIAELIHLNPDLSVRTLADQYFPRTRVGGQSLPSMAKLLKLRGDAARGKKLALGRAQCGNCHFFDGPNGKSVGPDLSGIGRKLDRTRLFDSILNPSASISFGYETWLMATDDGQVISGFVVGEGDPVLLNDAAGEQHVIPAETIEFRQRQAVSIMPEMAKADLNAQDLADIVEFLTNQKGSK